MKNSKKILFLVLVATICVSFSSCLVVVDDDALAGVEITYYDDRAKVVVENNAPKSGVDACYISNVYYKSSPYDEWTECWTNYSYYNDDDCSFYLDAGRYYFCVRVVYPNLSYRYDYYDDYYTNGKTGVAEGKSTYFIFDGENLY